MAMTKKRKSFQGKLRRKYKWSSNTNYNRGTSLIKPNACTYLLRKSNRRVTDMCVYFSDYEIRRSVLTGKNTQEVQITLTSYLVDDAEGFAKAEELVAYLTVEELELLCKIAKEKIYEVCCNIGQVEGE